MIPLVAWRERESNTQNMSHRVGGSKMSVKVAAKWPPPPTVSVTSNNKKHEQQQLVLTWTISRANETRCLSSPMRDNKSPISSTRRLISLAIWARSSPNRLEVAGLAGSGTGPLVRRVNWASSARMLSVESPSSVRWVRLRNQADWQCEACTWAAHWPPARQVRLRVAPLGAGHDTRASWPGSLAGHRTWRHHISGQPGWLAAEAGRAGLVGVPGVPGPDSAGGGGGGTRPSIQPGIWAGGRGAVGGDGRCLALSLALVVSCITFLLARWTGGQS